MQSVGGDSSPSYTTIGVFPGIYVKSNYTKQLSLNFYPKITFV